MTRSHVELPVREFHRLRELHRSSEAPQVVEGRLVGGVGVAELPQGPGLVVDLSHQQAILLDQAVEAHAHRLIRLQRLARTLQLFRAHVFFSLQVFPVNQREEESMLIRLHAGVSKEWREGAAGCVRYEKCVSQTS